MKTLLTTILVALASAGAAHAQQAPADAALKAQIGRLDQAHARAIFKSDAAALDSLMDDDIYVNHPTNRVVKEKAELMSLIKQGVIRYTAFERRPETFLFYNDMVVVMGNETVVPAAGAPNAGKKLQRRYTNVWMKKGRHWRLTIRHANNVCPN